jgi:hypothetical protein
VEIFHKSQTEAVALHPRSHLPGRYSTQTAHMPIKHQKTAEWSSERLVHWAEEIGPQTAKLAQAILASRRHPEQAFRSCLGILRLSSQVSPLQMETACQMALQARLLNYSSLKEILEHLPVSTKNDPHSPLPTHENIRGDTYYQ